MDYKADRCPNMNHGRPNPSIRFCPSCGETVSNTVKEKCDKEKHAVRRKDRDLFCVDCGVSLKS